MLTTLSCSSFYFVASCYFCGVQHCSCNNDSTIIAANIFAALELSSDCHCLAMNLLEMRQRWCRWWKQWQLGLVSTTMHFDKTVLRLYKENSAHVFATFVFLSSSIQLQNKKKATAKLSLSLNSWTTKWTTKKKEPSLTECWLPAVT